jgi:hypothetical protein
VWGGSKEKGVFENAGILQKDESNNKETDACNCANQCLVFIAGVHGEGKITAAKR